MKYLMILTIGICLLLTSVPAVADQPEDEAAIRKVHEHAYAGVKALDAKAWLATATEDIETWTGGLKGRAAIEKYYSEYWGKNKELKFKMVDDIGIVFVTPDVAIYKFRDEVSGALDADGNTRQPYKRLMAVPYVKKNGKWLWTTWFSRIIEE